MDRKEHKKADLIEADFVTTLLFKPVRASANYFTLYTLLSTLSKNYSSPHRLERYCEAAKSSGDVEFSVSVKDIVFSEMANGISVSNATTCISGTIYFFITK